MNLSTNPYSKKRHQKVFLSHKMLNPMRQWLETLEIRERKLAQLLAKIPASCPFARNIQFLGVSVDFPPLCKLNPFYESLMILRLRALTFLTKLS